ncbi:DUF3945 domain-containing protein [Dysgonomonas sp. ZJ709]|uniref:DUF3945 domain-containing protein n=1 Tax=Dysgonomonas sp. ZJ709 TaxID=2709797 RepID=UPI0013EC25A4|nr:DUF3945 domain-containing protein [Dysgonomonas sp. ZJ709]
MAKTKEKKGGVDFKAALDKMKETVNLFVYDKKDKSVEAVKEVSSDGKVKTVPAKKKHENEFLKVGNNSDALDILVTAIKNFYSQARDPTEFEILKVPFKLLKNSLTEIQKLISSNNPKNEDVMSKQVKDVKPEQGTIPENNTDKTYNFYPSQINWDKLKELGLSKEYLEQKGLLDDMLKGWKTKQLVPLNMQVGGATVKIDALLSLRAEQDGSVSLNIHGVKKEPELSRPFYGHNFSEDDKINLLTTGHMGRVVDLFDRSNQVHPSFISIDPLTKDLNAVRAASVTIHDEYSKVKLTDNEKQDLREGKEIYVEGMVGKTGKEFNAYLRVDANQRNVAYRFEGGLANIKKLGEVNLTENQQKDLQEGKVILVENMVSKQTGELRDAYVKADPVTGKLAFTNFNPDAPEGEHQIIIPRYVGQVELTKEDRKELSEGKTIFVENQVKTNGETYDSFVKLHPVTGNVQRSKNPDGFTDEVKATIPDTIMTVKVTASMRATLQDGKPLEVKGAKAADGSLLPTWAKLNTETGRINYFRQNPDQAKKAVVKTTQSPPSESQGTADEKKQKKRTGKSIS